MKNKNRMLVIAVVSTLLLLTAGAVAAQDTPGRPQVTGSAMVPIYPVGDITDIAPVFEFDDEGGNVTWYNIEVMDGTTSVMDEWFEASLICAEGTCLADPDIVLHAGVGDKDLSWTLSAYDSMTTNISEVGSLDFTILAANPTGPATVTDPSGSPMFEVEALPGVFMYRMYVQKNGATTPVIDEWVYVDDQLCEGDPEVCTDYLEAPEAPIYTNGSYTVWMQGFGEGNYTAWSNGFNFTVDISQPEAPSAFAGMADETIYADFGVEYIVSVLPCAFDEETEEITCVNAQPSIFVEVGDHGMGSISLRTPVNAERQYEISEKVYPIRNATQWFEVRIMQGAIVVYSEWINSYSDNRCFGETGGPGGFGTCFVPLPDQLANGDYTLEWRTYSPGGTTLSDYASQDFTVNAVQGQPVIDQLDPFILELGEIAIRFTNPDFGLIFPEWAELVITNTSDNSVVYSKWIEVLDVDDYIASIDATMLLTGDEYGQLDFLRGKIVCTFGCTAVLDTYLLNGTYEIEVRTWANGSMSLYSDPFELVLDHDVPSIPVDPADMTVMRATMVEGNARPIYGWSASAGATWYNLVVEEGSSQSGYAAPGDVVVNQWVEAARICEVDLETGDQYCQLQPEVDMAPGNYIWTVRGWSPGGMGNFSADQPLTISNATLTTPDPVSPNNGEGPYSGFPTFVWSPSENGSWYQIQVNNTSDNVTVYDEWVYVPNFECDPQCEYTDTPFTQFLSGNYQWRVRGANAVAVSAWSSFESFVVEDGSEPVFPISPSEDYYDGDVTFYWLPFASTTWYNLEVYMIDLDGGEPDFENLPTPVISEWYNANLLNAECSTAWVDLFFGSMAREMSNPDDPSLPPFYCELTIPDAQLETGTYIWRVNTWGPSFGAQIHESEIFAPFWKH